jgi:hypothetical protein
VKKKEKNANQIVGKFTNSQGDADNRTDKQRQLQSRQQQHPQLSQSSVYQQQQ